jgi:hypothetical protein
MDFESREDLDEAQKVVHDVAAEKRDGFGRSPDHQ